MSESKFAELVRRCKAEVSVSCNVHRVYYQKVADYVEELLNKNPDFYRVEDSELQKMIELDTVIELQFYPRTPIGFYNLLDYDLDRGVDRALAILNEDPKKNS